MQAHKPDASGRDVGASREARPESVAISVDLLLDGQEPLRDGYDSDDGEMLGVWLVRRVEC